MITDLRRAFGLLPQGLRWRWYGLLPVVLLAAFIEAAAAGAVFGLLQLLTTEASSLAGLSERVLTWLVSRTDAAPVVVFAVLVMGLYLARLAILIGSSYLKESLVFESTAILSALTLRTFLTGPLPNPHDTAAMVHRVERGPEIVSGGGFASVVHLVAETLVVAAFILLLAIAAPVVTLAAILATALVLLLPAALTHRLFRRWGQEEAARHEHLRRELGEGLGALREIRVYGREAFFRERFTRARQLLSRVQRRRTLASDTIRLGIETGFVLTLLLVVLLFTLSSSATNLVSLLGLYAYAGFRLVPSANRITLNLNTLRGASAVARQVVSAVERAGRTAEMLAPEAAQPLTFHRELVLSGVEFRYTPDAPPALSDIELRIARGDSVGIVGASGAGKSTLLDLILGLVTPTAGVVSVDGRDIHSNLRSWQQQIGYVGQSFYLLDGPLRNNVAFGVDPRQVSTEQLTEAVHAAQLESVVAALPQGLETPVGEHGSRLSGGERQRVAIARALYSRPSVVLFDEATAALDPKTERELTAAITAMRGVRTIIVIAHRMATVRACDRIVMLRNGRIWATGSFDELMATNHEFRALAQVAEASGLE